MRTTENGIFIHMLPSFSYSDSSLRRCKVPEAGERDQARRPSGPSPQMLRYALRSHQLSLNVDRGSVLHVREYVRVDFDRECNRGMS